MKKQQSNNQLTSFLKSGSLLSIIIIACIAVWVLTLFFPLVDYLYALPTGTARNGWTEWLAMSSDASATLRHPWTIITYMFLHNGLWHILFNMFMLYFGGILCCRYLNERRFGWIYFLSGIVGGLLYLMIYNLFPIGQTHQSSIVGSSAAVLGVFVAVAAYIPNQEVNIWPFRSFSFKIKYIVIALVVIDLLSIPTSNAGSHIANIGGALTGWIYVMTMRKDISGFLKSKPFQNKGDKKKNPSSERPMSDEEYNRRKTDEQKRIDAILDKISRSGYESLTKKEKETLFNYK
ncbi:MAG: rhomboid family intramembrane serine protease [Bacteroidales bacterium]|nr:rhomboid family intramembrane serine protease [Bacteroidales bacterium]